MLQRAYSILHVKAVDGERRQFSGLATSPEPDRVGDIVEPKGATFKNPLPLLLYHDSQRPVGTAKFLKPTDDGIGFEASIPEITEPGPLRDRVEEAWQSIKAGLIRGVSIGFRTLDDGIELLRSGGVRFTSTEILELSLVAIPANSAATITSIKSFDVGAPAASGTDSGVSPHTSGASDARAVVRVTTRGTAMKTYSEQIAAMEATRLQKHSDLDALQQKVAGEGRTKDETERESFNNLQREIKSLDEELVDLRSMEALNITKAAPVNGTSVEAGSASRGGQAPVITVRDNVPPGVGFARAVLCQTAAWLTHRPVEEIAKQRYPDFGAIHQHFHQKANVPAGTSTQAVWAGPLVYATNLESEFVEFLRPQTIIGKLNLTRVPFNVRIPSQTSGGTGYWVGEGAAKPLTSFAFSSSTLGYTKVAAISVITQELARFSSPSAEMLTRNALAGALVERIDIDFIDPAEAAVTGVKPASITNGLTAKTSAGTSADNARTDIGTLLNAYLSANLSPSTLVLIMPNTLAMALSLQVNSLGQPEFPGLTMNGGTLQGIPVITSQYAANASGGGNLVIAVNQADIFLADDGQVNVDASTEASLQMSDAPTMNSATSTGVSVVSMYQTNSIALRAERFINWQKRRAEAVVYMDDVNWGSVGSPA